MSRVNDLLMRCLGADENGGYQPAGFEARLAAVLADASRDERVLVQKVLNVAWEPGSWTQASLAEEMRVYERMLAIERPEQAPAVARALANRWAYGWR